MKDNNGRRKLTSRRSILQYSGAAALAGLAGCSGGGNSGDSGGGNSGASGGGNSGDSSGDQYPEFSRSDPQWPQLASTLMEEDFWIGTEEELEQLRANAPDELRYGDPPQEPPEDESEWMDPDPLIFTVSPGTSPSTYQDTHAKLIENLEKETGKTVDFITLNSAAAQIEAMRAERLHISRYSTGRTPYGVNVAGGRPFAMTLQDGRFGYKQWVITQADNDEINDLSDMAGKNIAHTSETSNSGNLAARALLPEQDPGVVPGEDYEIEYSGNHENSQMGVVNGDYDAAPTASSQFAELVRNDRFDPENIKVIWSSRTFPRGVFQTYYKLDPSLVEDIHAAFFDYDYTGTQMEEDLGLNSFAEVEYKSLFDVILQIQKSLGVEYEL